METPKSSGKCGAFGWLEVTTDKEARSKLIWPKFQTTRPSLKTRSEQRRANGSSENRREWDAENTRVATRLSYDTPIVVTYAPSLTNG